MAESYSLLLESLATLAPTDTIVRLQNANGDPAVLLTELPAIQEAIKSRPEDVTRALLGAITEPGQQEEASLLMRALVAADTADLQALASCCKPTTTTATTPEATAAGTALIEAFRMPEALATVHRLAIKLPSDVQRGLAPSLPPAARPLLTLAADMQQVEFIEMAQEVAKTLGAALAPAPTEAVALAELDSYDIVSEASASDEGFDLVSPGSSTKSLASPSSSVLPSRGFAAGAAAAAAPPGVATVDPSPAAAKSSTDEAEVVLVRRGVDVPVELGGGRGGPAAVTEGAVRTAWLLLRSQLRLQASYLATALPTADLRALCLGSASLGVVCGLVGSVGSLLTLEPASLVLSLALTALALALALLEADGATATALGASVLAHVPCLRTSRCRAGWSALSGLVGMLAGPAVLSLLTAPLLFIAAPVYAASDVLAATPLRRLQDDLYTASSSAAASTLAVSPPAKDSGTRAGALRALRARFAGANAGVEMRGVLRGAELSQLSAGIPAGGGMAERLSLRGVEIALCPLGGSGVTLASLEAWLLYAADPATACAGPGPTVGSAAAAVANAAAAVAGAPMASAHALATVEAGSPRRGGGRSRQTTFTRATTATSDDEPGWLLAAGASVAQLGEQPSPKPRVLAALPEEEGGDATYAPPPLPTVTGSDLEVDAKADAEAAAAALRPRAPTCYGHPWPSEDEKVDDDEASWTAVAPAVTPALAAPAVPAAANTLQRLAVRVRGVLLRGPTILGWTAQPSSALLGLGAACLGAGALVALMYALLSAPYGRVELLITEAAPAAAVLTSAFGLIAIELSLLAAPVGPTARRLAIPLLRGCPPLSLGVARAAGIVVAAAALNRCLPPHSALSGALSLLSAALALAAASLCWRVSFALVHAINAHCGEGAVYARLAGTRARDGGGTPTAAEEEEEAGYRRVEELRSMLASVGCTASEQGGAAMGARGGAGGAAATGLGLLMGGDPLLEGCVSLDLDRDGIVGNDDLARFYGHTGGS